MGKTKYSIIDCIDRGLDYKAETILSAMKCIYYKIEKLIEDNANGKNNNEIKKLLEDFKTELFEKR